MNKSDLIDVIGEAAQVPKNVAGKTLEKILDSITKALCEGEDVSLVGFGALCVRHRKARTGRNPKTGESIPIKASNVVAFKAGKVLKDAVQKE